MERLDGHPMAAIGGGCDARAAVSEGIPSSSPAPSPPERGTERTLPAVALLRPQPTSVAMAAAAAYAGRGSAELPRVAIYRGKAEVLLPPWRGAAGDFHPAALRLAPRSSTPLPPPTAERQGREMAPPSAGNR